MSVITGGNAAPVYNVILDVVGTVSSGAAFASIINPFGVDAVIFNRALNVTTASGTTGTIDIGVAATLITADNLIDGANANAVALASAAGTNGGTTKLWPAGQYVTVSESTGDAAGMIARLHIMCAPIA